MSREGFAGKRALITHADQFMGPALQDALRLAGSTVIADTRDLSSEADVEACVKEAGEPDLVFINLAVDGIGSRGINEIDEGEWQRVYDRIVHPLHRLVRALAPSMIERGSGKLVLLGSSSPLRARTGLTDYNSARAAQLAYVRSAALELAQHNVQFNAVAQNWIDNPTYFPKSMQEHPKWPKLLAAQVPAARLGTATESVELALYLASPQADFMVGKVMELDGGWSN